MRFGIAQLRCVINRGVGSSPGLPSGVQAATTAPDGGQVHTRTARERQAVRGFTEARSAPAPLVLSARPDDVLRNVDRRFLTVDERRRSGALRHPADRDAYLAAHLLVRCCAARLTGEPTETLELVQRCSECGSGRHGKPSLRGLPHVQVSLAHTRGAVVAGAAWGPIGVDVESLATRGADTGGMAYVLTCAEIGQVQSSADPPTAFLRHWVRKECLVKIGVITLDTMRQVDLTAATEETTPGGRAEYRYGTVHVVDWLDPLLGAVLAVAGSEPPVIGSFPRDDRGQSPAGAADRPFRSSDADADVELEPLVVLGNQCCPDSQPT